MTQDLKTALDNPVDAPIMAREGDKVDADGAHDRPAFPPGCPIRPLGISSNLAGSQLCFYLDVNKQLVGLEAGNRHGKNSLIALFGTKSDWLEEQWPQWSKPVREYDKATKTWTTIKAAEIVGFDQAEASRALIEECARRGIFTAAGRMRGAGAHRSAGGTYNNGLVLHCGDQLLASQHRLDGTISGWKFVEPGLHENYVYRGVPAIPRPAYDEVPGGDAGVIRLVELLQTWNWKRPEVDVRLLLGAIGASFIGGALEWRPNVWITGGKGVGKSTLNSETGVLAGLFGEGVFKTGNASAAAVRQSLQNSTVPVMFDEIEAKEDNRLVQAVIELARISSSGGTQHRGGQDHQAHEFTLRSCFWFSSINIPPLQPQDRSRLAILELKPLLPGAKPPDLGSYHLPQLGRTLIRRMVDGWHRLEGTIAMYHATLSAVGHDARGCMQFGTLLACADLLLHDWDINSDGLPDDEECAHWARLCAPHKMAEIREADPDHEMCLDRLGTSQVQERGGDPRVQLFSWIGDNVDAVARVPGFTDDDEARFGRRLHNIGLKLVNPVWNIERLGADGKAVPSKWGAQAMETTLPGFLAIAGHHRGLETFFDNTAWQRGGWRQSLARFPGAIDGVKVKFGRASKTAVLVPLASVLDDADLPPSSRSDALAEWWAVQVEAAKE